MIIMLSINVRKLKSNVYSLFFINLLVYSSWEVQGPLSYVRAGFKKKGRLVGMIMITDSLDFPLS